MDIGNDRLEARLEVQEPETEPKSSSKLTSDQDYCSLSVGDRYCRNDNSCTDYYGRTIMFSIFVIFEIRFPIFTISGRLVIYYSSVLGSIGCHACVRVGFRKLLRVKHVLLVKAVKLSRLHTENTEKSIATREDLIVIV